MIKADFDNGPIRNSCRKLSGVIISFIIDLRLSQVKVLVCFHLLITSVSDFN